MNKINQRKFIRFMKELNVYSEFVRAIRKTAIDNDEIMACMGLSFRPELKLAIKDYLDKVSNHNCLFVGFTWIHTQMGHAFWSKVDMAWKNEVNKERAHNYRYMMEMIKDFHKRKNLDL